MSSNRLPSQARGEMGKRMGHGCSCDVIGSDWSHWLERLCGGLRGGERPHIAKAAAPEPLTPLPLHRDQQGALTPPLWKVLG